MIFVDGMKDRFEAVGFGALNWDDNRKVARMLPPGGETSGKVLQGTPGGNSANTVAGLSRLGIRTAYIGAVGTDAAGKTLVKNLEHENVEPLVLTKEGSSGNCLILSDDSGERSIYVFPEVNDTIQISDISPETVGRIEEAEYFHTGNFACLNSFDSLETQLALAQKARNFSFAPGNLYANSGGIVRKNKNAVLEKLFRKTDVLFLNRDECRMFTGEDYADGAKSLIKNYGIGIVALTLGARGCLVQTKNDSFEVSSFKPMQIKDTTGAGDAFAAGFLFGMIKGKNPETCGKTGNFVASKCLEGIGARAGLPYLKDLPKELV